VVEIASLRQYYKAVVLNVYKQKPAKRRVFIVAGAGFEPATSGL